MDVNQHNINGSQPDGSHKQTSDKTYQSPETEATGVGTCNFRHQADCPLNERNYKMSNNPEVSKVYMRSNLKNYNEDLIFVMDTNYLKKCDGIVKLIQIVLSSVTLIMVATSGRSDGGLLHLPLSWHYRVMLFVLILSILTSVLLVLAHITNVISLLPIDWILFDLVLYSIFAFLYLVGTSLIASAFDFYDKMDSEVSQTTLNQLVVCVVLGYTCMLLYGLTAVASYRMWKIQCHLYQRKRLIEEEEYDI